VWVVDGNSSPWLRPQRGVYVFSSQPTIIYPTPSTTAITTTSGHSETYLCAFGATGSGYFDLGTTTSYGLIHEFTPITTPGTAWLVCDNWGPPALTPEALYHWRFTFTASEGATFYGVDQTFRTLPDGRVTTGTGTPASCTEAAFNVALAAAGTKEIVFDCGLTPVTITMTASRSITTGLTINGGNRVTLQRQNDGAGNHFNVQAGAQLTLTQITLSNAVNTSTCGGTVQVLAGGILTLSEARFVNNRSNAQGGAVCNWGTTNATAAVFTDNVSVSSHGGAIGSYGSLTLTNSLFVNNRSAVNGGGIDMGGTTTVTSSSFTGNAAGYRGGGINTYGGTLNVTESSFTRNTAGLYGGGLANDASNGAVTGSTFSGSSSSGPGGGVELGGPQEGSRSPTPR
jgi:hypothetical protein